MNKFFWFGLIIFSAFLTAYSSVWGLTQSLDVILEIPETVTINGPNITLPELGMLQGGTKEMINALRQVNLGIAPRPGEIRTLNKSYLTFIIQQHKFPQTLYLKMGDQVSIKANAFCVQDQDIQKAIEEQMVTQKPHLLKKWVEVHNLPKKIWLSQPNWKIEVSTVGRLPEAGTALFKVTITSDQEKKVLNVSGKIRATALLYKAIRKITAQTELKPMDFQLIETELVNGKEMVGAFPIDFRSTRLIKQNDILQQDQMQPIPQVLKEHSVTVLVKNENIEIHITGIAKMDGWLGDDISIVNPTSGKIFRGKVVDSSTVEVHF